MDIGWADEDGHGFLDYAVLGVIGVAVLACGMVAFGGLVAHFVVSSAYSEYNFAVAFAAAAIGALIAAYLLMTWVSVDRIRTAVALVVLLAGMGYISVNMGVPATLGSLQGRKETVVFTVTGYAAGSRRSCSGVYATHPDFGETRLCNIRADTGAHVALTGKRSWFGLSYTDVRVVH
jgi:hypothetical protein